MISSVRLRLRNQRDDQPCLIYLHVISLVAQGFTSSEALRNMDKITICAVSATKEMGCGSGRVDRVDHLFYTTWTSSHGERCNQRDLPIVVESTHTHAKYMIHPVSSTDTSSLYLALILER